MHSCHRRRGCRRAPRRAAVTMSEPPATPLLRVEGLTAGFDVDGRYVPVVRDVSFTVAPGETLGLVGESGCGKSSTALALLRLLPPAGRIAGGRVVFGGRDLLAVREPELRAVRGGGIGLVFQDAMSALNPVFTAGDQVAEALVAHGRGGWSEARRRAVDLLDEVRLADPGRVARSYPHQLSGGMRQRVMIAIALACRPALVIADEPTTALDVTIQAEILDLLAELRDSARLALLLVTHDLGVIARMAHRVAVMYAGQIVEDAPVSDLFHRPQHPYTRALLAAVPGRELSKRPAAIPGSAPAPGATLTGCPFAPRCSERLDPCGVTAPALHDITPDHRSRCHLHDAAADLADAAR
jgi:peptide/nickel transport system ATP-binding protein